MSTAPLVTRNSARWKPSGSFSRTVFSITRGPAKPISAFGSAITTSPMKANEADTPPMVGSVSTLMNGNFFSDSLVSMAVVFAICISDSKPSCMRAPPVAVMQMNGTFCSSAICAPRTKRSPTTEPMEPPMNSNSKHATTTGRLMMAPPMTTIASVSPVASMADFRRSGYFLLSLNFRVSTGRISWPIS